ncbi:2-keto-4-pentenoate hydratase [Halomonas sp. ML-15]|uniref:2-keto-4-pentenoate hydratase n=1 Tax=Halomonas sp. ML-15 TaxID=2773305 RepID=UPI0017470A74|nr:2-keto-4-pentenoate hydratase [Halomonas sp. ML-15]MBD3896354.1 2-keto-4-pentenoate hydratase [Halomonas sp. ML-15]
MNDSSDQAASLLEGALNGGARLSSLPSECRPRTSEEAYRIQQRLVERLGTRAGWKVGAASPESAPHYSALPARLLHEGHVELPWSGFAVGAIEAEVAFRMKQDLLPRDTPYTRDEVLAAVGSAHAAIEIVDSRFRDWPDGVDKLSQLADLQNNGCLVIGDGEPAWHALPLAQVEVALTIGGQLVVSGQGGNPAGDPASLLVWLANALPQCGQALRAGEFVTCGSYTGKIVADRPVEVEAVFAGIGRATLRLT